MSGDKRDLPLFAYVPYGGEAPAQKHSETSVVAAIAIKKAVPRLQMRVLAFLGEHGPATDEEMQARIPMGANTQRPRRRELELTGYVVDSGKRRLNTSGKLAVVWKVT